MLSPKGEIVSFKYTFEIDGVSKTIHIADDVLAQGKKEGLSTQETIDRYLSDEGYIVDPTVAALTDKAKNNGVNTAGRADGSKKRKAPTRKPDEVKRALIAALNDFICDYNGADNITVTNIERMITFSIGEDNYELTLSKKRKPKT